MLGVKVPFAEYATHDNRVESSERMDNAAIIKAVASEREIVVVAENEDPDASDSEEGVVESNDTRETQEEEIIKTSTEFLHIISQQKAYVLHNKLPKSLLKELLNIENAIVASKAKSCNTQTKLLSFFRHYLQLIMADVSNGQLRPILYLIIFTCVCILFNRCTNKTNFKLFESYLFILYIVIFHMTLICEKRGVPVAQSCLH